VLVRNWPRESQFLLQWESRDENLKASSVHATGRGDGKHAFRYLPLAIGSHLPFCAKTEVSLFIGRLVSQRHGWQ